jgi:hypothetical protein
MPTFTFSSVFSEEDMEEIRADDEAMSDIARSPALLGAFSLAREEKPKSESHSGGIGHLPGTPQILGGADLVERRSLPDCSPS